MDDKYITSVDIELKKFLSFEPRCLSGRATTVILAQRDKYSDLGTEIWQRHHEGKTLEIIHYISDENDPDMKRHLIPMGMFLVV